MKVTDQVTTFKQSVKLKELGIIQCSIHHWLVYERSGETHHRLDDAPGLHPIIDEYSAYTVAELGIMLGKHWENKLYYPETIRCYDNEAIDRANLLIARLKSGALAISKVNKNLK